MLKLSVVCLLSVAAYAQTPVVTNVLNAGLGDTALAPLSQVYIYGSFPKAVISAFTVTVGGRPGYVDAVNSTGYITAALPGDAPLGTQPLVVTYRGTPSNTFPVTLTQYAPEFLTTSVVPVTPQGPSFPLPTYYPFAHTNGVPVTMGAPASPGEHIISLISGVGATSPPITLGGINSFTSMAVQPVVTVGGLTATIFRAGSSSDIMEVDFIIPDSTPVGFAPVTLKVAGVPSNTITIAVGAKPFITAALNAASFRQPGVISPGSIMTIFGAGFGLKDNFTAFPSTNVNGTLVMFGANPIPQFALAALEGQINALVPYELPPSGTVDLTIQDPRGISTVTTLNLAPSSPGIFFFQDPKVPTRRQAAALLPNTAWLSMPTSMAANLGIPNDCSGINKLTTCAQPAHVGDVLQIFVTGLGRATPQGNPGGKPLVTGTVAPANGNPLYLTIDTPVVQIGGIPAKVQFSGIAPGFAGLYQVNVQIPAGVQPGDDVTVEISMPGSAVDTATVAVAP